MDTTITSITETGEVKKQVKYFQACESGTYMKVNQIKNPIFEPLDALSFKCATLKL